MQAVRPNYNPRRVRKIFGPPTNPSPFYRPPTPTDDRLFHQFAWFPVEIRLAIWSMVFEPRMISFERKNIFTPEAAARVGRDLYTDSTYWIPEHLPLRQAQCLEACDFDDKNYRDPNFRGIPSGTGPVTLWVNRESREHTLSLYFPLFLGSAGILPIYFSPSYDVLDISNFRVWDEIEHHKSLPYDISGQLQFVKSIVLPYDDDYSVDNFTRSVLAMFTGLTELVVDFTPHYGDSMKTIENSDDQRKSHKPLPP